MFFNANLNYVYQNSGPITRSFIDEIPLNWHNAVFDSRVHMLMPGWYPAIPGYHHDDVPRSPISPGQHFLTAGQPDYDNTRYYAEHLMGLVNGEICPTEFVIGKCAMRPVPEGELIYRQWHKEIEFLIDNGEVKTWLAPSGALIKFDWQTFHTGTKAIGSGWRWFCRLTSVSARESPQSSLVGWKRVSPLVL